MGKICGHAAAVSIISSLCVVPAAHAQSNEELAKDLANPIASLISVPVVLDYESGVGAEDEGKLLVLLVQPVIPFSLNEDWNVISRTIVTVIAQNEVVPGAGNQSGLGDIVQSAFFSPEEPTADGWIWGAGPVILLPTATRTSLGFGEWGVGPTAVVLKQSGPWTVGGLAGHVWSVAGDDDRDDVSRTLLEPWVSHTTGGGTTLMVETESVYDWISQEWAVPLYAEVSRVVALGDQLVSVGAGVRYWVGSMDDGPEGCGVRLQSTLLFPR
jgi:hypothetical protein